MLQPAYSMDAAPGVYASALQSPAESRTPVPRRAARSRLVLRIAAIDRAPATSRLAAPWLELEPHSADAGGAPADAVSATASRRRRLARVADVCGWLFLGCAVFCFAQPLLPFASTRRGTARMAAVLPALVDAQGESDDHR